MISIETDAADSAHRIAFDELSVQEILGEGAFAVVYRGLHKGSQIAVKRLKYVTSLPLVNTYLSTTYPIHDPVNFHSCQIPTFRRGNTVEIQLRDSHIGPIAT